MTRAAERTLVVESRDLDTDERSVDTFLVALPSDQADRRAQLEATVARLHPDARMRSFDGSAASFLGSQQLVVAHYRDAGPQDPAPPSSTRAARVEQQPLFAA